MPPSFSRVSTQICLQFEQEISASFDLENRCAFLGQFQGTPGTGGTTGRDDPNQVNFTVKTFVVYTALNS